MSSNPTLPLPTQLLASSLTERAGVLWGALDAPIGIRLEVETLAAEQFCDDAFELRLWRERERLIFENDISVPRNSPTLGGIRGKRVEGKNRVPGPHLSDLLSKLSLTSFPLLRKLGCGSLLLPLTTSFLIYLNLFKWINSYSTAQPEVGEGREGEEEEERYKKRQRTGEQAGLLKGQCVSECGGAAR